MGVLFVTEDPDSDGSQPVTNGLKPRLADSTDQRHPAPRSTMITTGKLALGGAVATLAIGLMPALCGPAWPASGAAAAAVTSAPSQMIPGTLGGFAPVAPVPRLAGAAVAGSPRLTSDLPGVGLATGSPVAVLTQFAGLDRASERNAYGIDAEPPDTQVAVGAGRVVEAVNSIIEVYDESGVAQESFDLRPLLGVTGSAYVTDPSLLFDPASSRWFITALVVSPGASRVALAVSSSPDPTGRWVVGTASAGLGMVREQPKAGVGGGKVVVAWNDFATGGGFLGSELLVLDEAAVLAGHPTVATASAGAPDPGRFGLLPVSPPAGADQVLVVYNGSSGPVAGPGYVGVVSITGRPAAGNTTLVVTQIRSDSDGAAFAPTVPPPPAAQPGTSQTIDAGDDRFVSAAQRGGRVWVAAGDACPGAGGDCLRLIALDPTNLGAGLIVDEELGGGGVDDYYPAVAIDGTGTVFVTFSESSPSLYPSLALMARSGAGSDVGPVLLGAGQGDYGGARWGDYSGAASDPVDPGDVWVAGEYQASGSDPGEWGTVVARTTVSPPTVGSVSPARGELSGGTAVVIGGADFVAGSTSVLFGTSASPSVAVTDPDTLSAVVPPNEAPGAVAVTVQTPEGLSAAGPGGEDAYGGVPGPAGKVAGRPGAVADTAVVTWSPPPDDGGSPLTGYLVSAWTTGPSVSIGPNQLSVTVGGLDGSRGEVFSVAALNDQGRGLDSAPSAPVWTGAGYWSVTSAGGVFSFGDAGFFGSAGGSRLAAPIVGMAASPDGGGYWLVGADGGVFSFGDAGFFGSAGGSRLAAPIVGMAASPDGGGYWLSTAGGAVLGFGDAANFGPITGAQLGGPVIGLAGLAG